jgi:hypothetical protein
MAQSPQLIAISKEKVLGKAWRRYTDYAFAAGETLIPLVIAELTQVVPAMPLGFVQSGEGFQLVAVTALQPGASLFVAPDGRWLGAYVPAALRGYPFRLLKPQDREDSVLCIDEASGLVVEAGQGETFFDEDGQPSKAIRDVLELLSQVERSRMATAASLVQPWPLGIKQGEQNVSVTGLYRIDETALNALENEAFLTLRRSGALPMVYAQLFSMNQLAVLQRLSQIQAKLNAPVPTVAQNFAGLRGIGLSQDNGTLKFS